MRRAGWVLFDRALQRAAEGDFPGARRVAKEFRREGPRAQAMALDGCLMAAEGLAERALPLLSRAARLCPRAAWIRDWQARALFVQGDRPAARETMLEAVRLEPTPQRMRALAQVCEQLGFLKEAMCWAQQSRRDAPSAEAHALVALLWNRQRQYLKSAAQYARAIQLDPTDAGLRLARSQALALQGGLKQALQAAPRAAADPAASLWRAQLEALLGKEPAGSDPFAQGYAHLSSGRWEKAAKAFARVTGPFSRKARFYLTVSRMLKGPRPASEPGLSMIGLGVDPPYSATVEALRELSRCHVIFNNVSGTEAAELLWPLCRDVRPIFSEGGNLGAHSRRVLRELERGRRVGFVTRGSALVFGELGTLLAKRCRSEGLAWACLPALGSADLFEARYGGPSSGAGILSGNADLSGKHLDPGVPWTVFVPEGLSAARFKALSRALASRLGPSRRVLLFDHTVGQEPIRSTLADLSSLRSRLSPASILRVSGPGDLRPTGRGPELLLIGLGPRPRDCATIESLEALGRASVVCTEGLDRESLRFVKRFAEGKLRSFKLLKTALRSGRTAAYLTPHHPFRFGSQTAELLRVSGRCSLRALAAVSAESAACAAAGLPLGTSVLALQSFEAGALRRGEVRAEPGWPSVVYSPDSPRLLLQVPGVHQDKR